MSNLVAHLREVRSSYDPAMGWSESTIVLASTHERKLRLNARSEGMLHGG